MKTIDLSGIWDLNMENAPGALPPARYPDRIRLPGTTSLAGLGPEATERESGCLTELHPFKGRAWYRRDFACDMEGPALLTLERTRITEVWLDGTRVGAQDSLCTPHRYYLPRLAAGKHTLAVCVDNAHLPVPGGHMTAKDTQTNWNGVTGAVSLTFGRVFPAGIRVVPTDGGRTLRVLGRLLGAPAAREDCAFLVDGTAVPADRPPADGRIDCVLSLPAQLAPWDPAGPVLHTLTMRLGEQSFDFPFGVRTLGTDGRKLLINGRPVFLRGKHDALVFPQTGFAPTDEAAWTAYLNTVKSYGLNHLRFHTCCPPDAAFRAADALGMLLEPELPFWGTLHAPGEEGFDEQADRYLFAEGMRILEEFGHHPSFFLFSLGNELWGSRDRMAQWIRAYRAAHPQVLYTAGSNNFQFMPEPLEEEDVFVGVRLSRDRLFRGSYAMCDAPQGIVQTTEPESVSDYDGILEGSPTAEEAAGGERQIQYGDGVKTVTVEKGPGGGQRILPVISHEVGQYAFYPNLEEGALYTGPLRPLYLDIWRDRLQKAGLYRDRHRFFQSAGRLACDCYRREIETALRSRQLAGFQLLDLQDYPGQGAALVGILDPLMNSKGLITAEEWRCFCGDTVPLARIERFVLPGGSRLRFGVQVSECRPEVTMHRVAWQITADEGPLCGGTLDLQRLPGERLGDLKWVLTPPLTPARSGRCALTLRAGEDTCLTYPLWILHDAPVRITKDGITVPEGHVAFLHGAEAAGAAGPHLRIPDREGRLPAEYASDFWSYRMFRDISRSMGKPEPVGTMGLCVDPADPLLALFPTDDYTTPLWYTALKHAHCEPITDPAPAVQMIDTPERAQRLGILYRQDGEVCLTCRLWEAPEDPSVRLLARSVAARILAER